jgi:hypothetical protein
MLRWQSETELNMFINYFILVVILGFSGQRWFRERHVKGGGLHCIVIISFIYI